MKWRCKNSKRYKGVRRPTCGCFTCWFKFLWDPQPRAKRHEPLLLDMTDIDVVNSKH